ncbi:macro domain-containing protein [bacterium]|nr:macro domain-containing protein [bacterium]
MDLEELKSRIELRLGDIADVEADAIVNAANTDLILAAGVSGAIGRKGGTVIQDECSAIGSVRLGDAVPTSAGDLKAQYVIHAASMEIGHFAIDRNIARATRSALARADELGLKTIAFPAIGTGVAAFPADKCAQLMLAEVARHLVNARSVEKVLFILIQEEVVEAFREAYDSLTLPSASAGGGARRRRPRHHGRRPRGDNGGGERNASNNDNGS